MTRVMYDAINPELIPLNVNPPMVAGYVNGNWPSYNGYTDSNGHYVPSIRERFPHAIHVSIAVNIQADAQVLDCETSDATPAECPGWVTRQRARGQEPTVYMNSSTWPYVVNEFFNQKVKEPQWWVAQYDNKPVMMPGAVAKQYGGVVNQYDLSIVADNWPGIDTAISEDDEMKDYLCANSAGTQWVVAHDLSSRTGIPNQGDLQTLLATGQYLAIKLDDAQLGLIPTAMQLASPIVQPAPSPGGTSPAPVKYALTGTLTPQ